MVDVDMNLMPLKVIGREACLWVIKGYWTHKVSKHLKEGRVKRNKGHYEGGRWRYAS
jgi:hypothetical protein